MDILLLLAGLICLFIARKKRKAGKDSKVLRRVGWVLTGIWIMLFLIGFGFGLSQGFQRGLAEAEARRQQQQQQP